MPPASATPKPPHQRTPARQVELILERLDALPTLSPVAVRLLSVVSSDNARIEEIVRLIESDPGLTTRILALIRRASHGLGDRVTTVRHATTMLGLEAIQSAVLGLSIYELFEHAGHEQDNALASGPALAQLADAPALDRVRLWTHLIGVACAAESLARHNPASGVKPAEAFICGLLHDMGKLSLDLCLPASYARVIALAERRRIASAEAERAVIGLDHHTAAKRLAERWGLPTLLRDAVWFHSRPLESLPAEAPRSLLGVLAAARALCRELHIGSSFDFGRAPSSVRCCEEAGLDPGMLGRVTEELHEAVAERCAALGLSIPTAQESMLGSIAQANRKLASLNAALDERARQAEAMRAALAAVGRFNQELRDPRRPRSTGRTLALIADSLRSIDAARRAFVAFVVQDTPGDTWHAWYFGASADHHPDQPRSDEIDSPRELDGSSRSLSDMLRAPGADARMLGLLPWLTDCMSGAPDLLKVRAIPLCIGAPVGSMTGEPATVMLTDLDATAAGLTPGVFETLVASWGAAVAATGAIERALRTGECLAASARELEATQARLTEAQALSRLGEMAAGAAHEMNNPLTVIRARAQLLLRRLTNPADRAAAEAIAQGSSQISDLITSMHLLAHPPTPEPGPVRPRELAEIAVRKAMQRTGLDCDIDIEVPTYLPHAHVDQEMFSLALSELVANAIQSCAARSEDQNAPHGKVRVHAHIDPADDRLCFLVEDQGPGMSEHTLAHAFDPFFSERPAGRRRGMGLARARSIIAAHDGTVTLESSPGSGVRARITLPVWRGEQQIGQAA
ncbi:MAG: HDOD domain-containing protein [Phycisphaeraceae bacterium]|nr:MAG: HDOD domain-containing protein [Phycisphaeraceae bacterium]